MNGMSFMAGGLEWWYPVAVWAVVLAALGRAVLPTLHACGLHRPTLRWLPVAAGAIAIIPVAGLPLGRWLHAFNASFSLPLVALLCDFALGPLLQRPLFDAAAKRAALWFGVAAGLLLYPAALGLGCSSPRAGSGNSAASNRTTPGTISSIRSIGCSRLPT